MDTKVSPIVVSQGIAEYERRAIETGLLQANSFQTYVVDKKADRAVREDEEL